jgi:GNAT superfamily N-acetyltransferase
MTELRLSTDPADMDAPAIHAVLTQMYWARDIPLEIVQRAIAGSIPVGVFDGDAQVAFARVVTDRATFAYLADVYVLDAYRGRGIARRMMDVIMSHPDLQGLRRWILGTRDAHGLYAKFGFAPLAAPDRFMERADPDIYTRLYGRTTHDGN